MVIMTAVAGTIALGFVYLVNKDIELGYLDRRTQDEGYKNGLQRAQELREQGGFRNRLTARTLEKIHKEPKPETPLSKTLREYWDAIENQGTIGVLKAELTTFPTFRGIYRSLRPQEPQPVSP